VTKAEMTTLVNREVKGLSSYLTDDNYSDAADDAARETGWAFPVAGDFKIMWQKQRMKRSLFFMLKSESSYKFKHKQENLQHRFHHFEKMIKDMDAEFIAIQEDRPDQFANGVSTYELFGATVSAGFSYENQTGRDTTYSDSNKVILNPNENDA